MPWESGFGQAATRHPSEETWHGYLRGGYPELVAEPDFSLWHQSYLQTYLERDVRSLRQIGDLTQYQLFLRALAARTGSCSTWPACLAIWRWP